MLMRVAVFFGVIFGIVFGVTYAKRNAANRKRIKGIERELRALAAGLAEGVYDKPQYDALTQAILERCRAAGIAVPPGLDREQPMTEQGEQS